MTLSNSQSSGNSNNEVLVQRPTANNKGVGSSGGSRRNLSERGQQPKTSSFQCSNKIGVESERSSKSIIPPPSIISTCSQGSRQSSSLEQGASPNSYGKSKNAYLDDRFYKLAPERLDESIQGRDPSIRQYTRSALYLLRNDSRSRCRPKCASKLQSLSIWKTSNSYGNTNQQSGGNSNSTNSFSTIETPSSSLLSSRIFSATRQQDDYDLHSSANYSQKGYLDHRSISSSHLMPAFAKRRIGNSAQSISGSSTTGGSYLSNDSLKVHSAGGKGSIQKQFLSPQRKNVNSNQMSKLVQLNNTDSLDVDREQEPDQDRCRDRHHERERIRDRESDINFNSLGPAPTANNRGERRIGSGRLLPRDVNWDYRSDKETNLSPANTGSLTFEKNVPSHSFTSNNSTQRLSSIPSGNHNFPHQRFDTAHRSPTYKDRNASIVGKNSSEYRSESRYEARRSFTRGEFERDNRGDNSNYVRRFMSELINQNANNNFANKSGSIAAVGGSNQNENRRRMHRNDEPEWFSSGPTSQHDTIELRGFDETEDSNSNSSNSIVGDEKSDKMNAAKQASKRNKIKNSETGRNYDANEKTNPNKTEHENDRKNVNPKNCTLISSSTPIPQATKLTGRLKSDTNNNSRTNSSSYSESKSSSECDESTSSSVTNKSKLGVTEENTEIGENKEFVDVERTTTAPSQMEGKTGFNFDAFLNVDPLSSLLMTEKISGENEVGSRFSRWFVTEGEHLKSNNESNMQMTKTEREPLLTSDCANTNQSNTLMEFLQRGKVNTTAGNMGSTTFVGSIPSVEELEARMRKIGDDHNNLNQEQPNLVINDDIEHSLIQLNIDGGNQQEPQQKQKPAQQFKVRNENQLLVDQSAINPGTQIPQQQNLQINDQNHINVASSQTQDMEAFKKLLEQITPNSLNKVKLTSKNIIQQLAPQQSQMQRFTPMSQSINILTAIGAMPPSQTAPHLMKNDELTKLMQQQQQQQQMHQRRQVHTAISGSQHPQVITTTPNEIPIVQAMFLAPQQRFEAQLLLQGLSRGEVTQNNLSHQLSNPNTSPRTKEVLAAVLRESSCDNSPNVIMPAPQVMSPVLGQSHSAPHMPPSPLPIIIPTMQQMAQPGTQQVHSSSGSNSGGLPQRIPSPRELQYHTQSIMQNALIKKKLEEQQENFRRRQEIQKQQMQHKTMQSPTHVEIHEFGAMVGAAQHQYSQHQKKAGQQQQTQQRHVNSPTPLAFTPTSVLRKMTAEKDSGSTFHTSAQVPAASTSIATLTGDTTSLASSSTTQQTTLAQNTPRMILGIGSHSQQQQQQQQQQQVAGIIAGPSIHQYQHPHQDNSRLNQTLRPNQIKWSGAIMNQLSINKPMGRPILKGNISQSISSPTNIGLNSIHPPQQQPSHPQIAFASKIEFQQIQQQRVTNQQQPPQSLKQQQQQQVLPVPVPHQSQNIVMTQIYQQRVALQRAQQYELQQFNHQQQQQINIAQSSSNRPDCVVPNTKNNQAVPTSGTIMNFQRDGGLSPTSNQLARWFSPELLAQASAGKLPPLNMNHALSLEEFEKSIQHSSAVVNN